MKAIGFRKIENRFQAFICAATGSTALVTIEKIVESSRSNSFQPQCSNDCVWHGGGTISSRTALRLINEWSLAHRAELEANWSRAREGEPLERIAPLD